MGIHLVGDDSQTAERDLLSELFSTRKNIAAYLHDTLSQHMVAMSFLLGRLRRDPAIASSPAAVRTLSQFDSLCETCSHDLRAINDALAPALPTAEECSAAETSSALQCFAQHMREDAGLPVRFEAASESAPPVFISPRVRTLLVAALQQWAEVAISQPRSAETHIRMESTASHFSLQFLSSQPADPAIAAINSSSALRKIVQAVGGKLGPATSHEGESACLTFPDITITEP